MIPVIKQQEPADFNEKVRIPGQRFLQKNPSPNARQFQRHNYWSHITKDLYRLYQKICAYTGEWFPETSVSVDHFIPKSQGHQLAYEWDNYRLTTGKMNNDKGDKICPIDPFNVQTGWFVLFFPSCFIKPCEELNEINKKRVFDTIGVLRLNSTERTEKRYDIIQDYINNRISFDFLKTYYPYISYELERQGLRENVGDYFKSLNLGH
jgi:hypothetical protein